MITYTINSEQPMNVYQVKKALSKIKKRDEELNFRANKTEEHMVSAVVGKKGEELAEELTKLDIARLKDVHIQKLVDVMPTTEKDVKLVLQGYTITVNADGIKKIVDTVAKYA